MKINSPADLLRGSQLLPGNNATPAKNSGTSAPANASSEVRLSNEVKELGKKSAAAEPFDEKRVAELRASIENGKYQINSGAIADKLIASTIATTSGK